MYISCGRERGYQIGRFLFFCVIAIPPDETQSIKLTDLSMAIQSWHMMKLLISYLFTLVLSYIVPIGSWTYVRHNRSMLSFPLLSFLFTERNEQNSENIAPRLMLCVFNVVNV